MKKNLLKLTFLALFVFALGTNADAQLRIGGGLVFNTDLNSKIGFDLRSEIGVGDVIVIVPNFNLYLPKDGVTTWEINGDVHYPFAVTDAVNVFPLAGLNITSISLGGFGSATEVGINLGGGANFAITDSMRIFAEIKYVAIITGYTPLVLGAGILFDLGS